MAPQIHRPDGKTLLAAVTTVAAVYVYFLIFAQFGFLHAIQDALGDNAGVVRPLMAVMGLAGITGSIGAARAGRGTRSRRTLAVGFALCAVVALWSLAAKRPAEFYAGALLIGLGTGLTTVTLAGMLRPAVGDGRLGLIIGLGTGLAYGLCNLPGIFEAPAATQAGIALVAVAAGLLGARGLIPRAQLESPVGGDYSRAGTARWVVIFLVLVCVDSAAFYIIQHTPALKQGLWVGSGRQMLNAGMHVVAGLFAGWLIDRRGIGLTVLLGAGGLLFAGFLMGGAQAAAGSGLLYIAGVTAYSTALVFYPARSGRPGLAALVYAVAGWGGSALGIGLAEGRDRLPMPGLVVAAVALAGALGWRYLASRGGQTMNENSGR
jgi:hypothetical protein